MHPEYARQIDDLLKTDGFFERNCEAATKSRYPDHFAEAAEAEAVAQTIKEYAPPLARPGPQEPGRPGARVPGRSLDLVRPSREGRGTPRLSPGLRTPGLGVRALFQWNGRVDYHPPSLPITAHTRRDHDW